MTTREHGLEDIASAMSDVAVAVKYLGNGNASTPMGAIEAHGKVVGEGCDAISGALLSMADAIQELAQAVSEQKC